MEWLCPSSIDPQSDQELRRALRTKNTGAWIFKNAKYEKWLNERGSFLWLYGQSNPPFIALLIQTLVGTGKSILGSSIIEKLSKRYLSPSTGLAYFYCDGNYLDKQKIRYILGSVLRQLIDCHEFDSRSSKLSHLLPLYERKSLPSEVLMSTLDHVSISFDRVYIIIDGLDECGDRDELLHVLSTHQSDTLNFLLTSRREKDIETAFAVKNRVGIDQEIVQRDIAAHIDWMLENNKNLMRIKPQLKQEIKEKLLAKSCGMYYL